MSTIIEQAADAAAAVALVQVTNELREARRELAEVRAEVARLKSGGWIPVTERLPEPDGLWHERDVIVLWCDAVMPGRLYDRNFGHETYDWIINNSFRSCDVTHWMPLPEPPTPTTASVPPAESESAAVPALGLLSEDVSREGEAL